jgi:hypothetical protein
MKIIFIFRSICLIFSTYAKADGSSSDTLVAAKVNFGRVLQDPLANFRGAIFENGFYGNTGIDDKLATVTKAQALYAMPMPEYGINFIPRVIVPIVSVPPLSDIPWFGDGSTGAADGRQWGVGDIIVQGFVAPAWLPYVLVEDIGATVERAVQLGGRLFFKFKGGAILLDPTGAAFGVQQVSK